LSAGAVVGIGGKRGSGVKGFGLLVGLYCRGMAAALCLTNEGFTENPAWLTGRDWQPGLRHNADMIRLVKALNY